MKNTGERELQEQKVEDSQESEIRIWNEDQAKNCECKMLVAVFKVGSRELKHYINEAITKKKRKKRQSLEENSSTKVSET